jgi:predicted NBD/HSP70 family sugar kinase
MNKQNSSIGLDIGGSHVCGAIVTSSASASSQSEIIYKPLDTSAGSLAIVNTISHVIGELVAQTNGAAFIGIAIPGPFNYDDGICEIYGVGGKFKNVFGLNLTEALKSFGHLPEKNELYFANDAHCFAVGAYRFLNLQSKFVVTITLGTGFGSAFLENGNLVCRHIGIPQSGAFYCESFKNSIADDYFSSRWFINEFKKVSGKEILSVKALALLAEEVTEAKIIFETFGANLAEFLIPWLIKFDCGTLVIGGKIARAWHLFGEKFCEALVDCNCRTKVMFCDDTEECIITGAAQLAKEKASMVPSCDHSNQTVKQNYSYRETLPALFPPGNETVDHDSNVYPPFQIPIEKIETGLDALAKKIALNKNVIIDGIGVVCWTEFRKQLNSALVAQGTRPLWYEVTACLKGEDIVDEMIRESLNGEDTVPGKGFACELIDFFDPQKLALLSADTDADISIVYGTGAALSNWDGPLVYLDVPKNEIQYQMRVKSITNAATSKLKDSRQKCSRFYFADCVILNRYMQQLLPEIDYLVDGRCTPEINWTQSCAKGTDVEG